MFLVLGLGNPGARYSKTRHNVGFLVADELARRAGESLSRNQLGAQVGKLRMGNTVALVAKPQSFMNLSGQPGVSLRGYYKLSNDEVVVIHDELDLAYGRIAVKKGGGHGGHNGLRDLISKLGNGNFVRVRVGVSRPPPNWEVADYVLANWTTEESNSIEDTVSRAADAVETILREGHLAAMNCFNVRPGKKGSQKRKNDVSDTES